MKSNDTKEEKGTAFLKDALSDALAVFDRKLLKNDPEAAREVLDSLEMEDRVRLISRLPGRDRVSAILLSEYAEELVKALPEPEFWITVKETGEEDSLDILRMATPQQVQHIFDLEWWEDDKLDSLAVVYWLNLLTMAGPEVPVKWFENADEELAITAFSRFFRVYKTDPDNEGAEPWRDLNNIWTLDNTYYLHFLEPKTAPAIEKTLEHICDHNSMRYYGLLEYITASLPIETETEAFRFRNARLADFGFVEFEEAIEIYAPLSDADLARLDKEAREGEYPPARVPVSEYPLALSEPPELFTNALKRVEDRQRIETVAMELGGLVNRLLIADSMDMARIESVKEAVDKAYTYIEMGLDRWTGGDPEGASAVLLSQHLINVFRAGYTRVVLLARSADRLKKQEWMNKTEYARELLDEDAPLIAGLSFRRPQLYEGADPDGNPLYREFKSAEDVARAEDALFTARVTGALFFKALGVSDREIGLLKEYFRGSGLTFSTVFITAVCRVLAGGEMAFAPLSKKDARAAIEIAMTGEAPRRIKDDVRADLKERVAEALSEVEEADESWTGKAREFVDFSLSRLEEEAGRISLADLDPRYLHCLVVYPAEEGGE